MSDLDRILLELKDLRADLTRDKSELAEVEKDREDLIEAVQRTAKDLDLPQPGDDTTEVIGEIIYWAFKLDERKRRLIEVTSRASLGNDVRGIEWNARVARPGWTAVGRLDGEDADVVVRTA